MKNFKMFLLTGLLMSVWNQLGVAEEIVLQNGLNGYDGCEDTYIAMKPAFTTFSNSDTLKAMQFYTAC